ncbi:YbhB/YbcL family Raf kinase inhibitor-like protein [Natronoglycomyces albus]|uniref:YbhB/YbcL family Raf kinase inhibitor-like protein n=1 Tax=Natronoglycomyces albus TaxID=2811108 RepID=A0A895XK34_9ACTN|nr:YbhB/YbcL family Raf kinase inhibitor-like protein [Natronoglycomyces albus]QSB05397.1 YbhB/YbcL family Raf kinase inhibitor-like protein [Natronoglycomyces albus]
MLDRPQSPNPYDFLPSVPKFSVTSADIADGETLAPPQTAQGGNVSPQLSWSGFPAETAAFAITCFDPDAPTASGWWHWMLLNLPVEVTELETGAGVAGANLGGAVQLRNDMGEYSFGGAAPPPGEPFAHRYIFAVHALKQKLDVPVDASCAVGGFNITFNVIGRGLITPIYQGS